MDSGGCSDHLRGRIFFTSDIRKPKGPFKFTNVIASQSEFLPRVENFWCERPTLYHSTSALFRFSKKLKELKPILRELSRQKLSDISRRTSEAYDELCATQLSSLSNPSPQEVVAESLAFKRWETVAGLEEHYLKQKSKLHWLQVGDKNIRSFYNAIQERHNGNAIHEIIDPMGTSLTAIEDIKREAVRYFSDHLTQEPADFSGITVEGLRELLVYRCTTHDSERLTAVVTEEEIKRVLFSMPSNKSPGPDGYTVEFFKGAWAVVGKELMVAIQSFFIYGFLPKGLNTTILAFIPKNFNVKEMKDYIPISCCNVLFKVISNILAN